MEKQPSSRTCFLCGRENDKGLKMTWYNDREKNQVIATVVVPEYLNSYPGVAHGGIVSTLLDETSGRAILMDDPDNLFVTARLEVRYRIPTPTQTPLTVVGWTVKGKKNYARVAAEVRLPDGTVTAEATALVVRPPAEFYNACNWQKEKGFWRVYED
ncbi:MAG TPA: thioesterase [Syntrophomonas sp.]|jgi:acyl-coenzyme A thioesterase PaaI-like protein|nr:thioesterase [Syntrophomonas sp.]HCF70311.1 thioesterase [Syntrophomonas sp.]